MQSHPHQPPPQPSSHYDDYNRSSSASSKRPRNDNRSSSSMSSSRDNGRDRDREREHQGSDLPSRTLFIRNVAFDVSEEQVRALFTKYGEIKTLFSMLERRGLVFVTYFDIRCADRARKELNGSKLAGRSIDVFYSVPKNEDMNSRSCDSEKNQGTILLTLKDGKQKLENEGLTRLFCQFGDLKVVRDFKGHPNQRFIEFFDSRHCVAAVRGCAGMSYNGGTLDCRHAWDAPHKYRSGEAIPKHEYRSDLPFGPSSSSSSSSKRSRHSDDRPSRSGPPAPVAVHPQGWAAPGMVGAPHPYPMNPMAAEAQQAQQMLTALTQSIQVPNSSTVPMMAPPSVVPQHVPEQFSSTTTTLNSSSSAAMPPSNDSLSSSLLTSTSPTGPSVIPGTEALAQMNQLLQLLQQNPVVSPTEADSQSGAPSDPRQRRSKDNSTADDSAIPNDQSVSDMLADGIGMIDTIPDHTEVKDEFPEPVEVRAKSAEIIKDQAEAELPDSTETPTEQAKADQSPSNNDEPSDNLEKKVHESDSEQINVPGDSVTESTNAPVTKKRKLPVAKSRANNKSKVTKTTDTVSDSKPEDRGDNSDTEKRSNEENEGDHSVPAKSFQVSEEPLNAEAEVVEHVA